MRADQCRAVVFLQGRCKKFGRRNALVVHQNSNWLVDHLRIRLIHGFTAALGAQRHNRTLRQQQIEHFAHFLDAPTAVVPHIQHQRLRAICQQSIQHLLELVCHPDMKTFDADITDLSIQHLTPRHLLRHRRALHGRLMDSASLLLTERHGYRGAFLSLNRVNDGIRAIFLDCQALRTDDVIAFFDAGLCRRRIVIHQINPHTIFSGQHRNADATAFSLAAQPVGFILIRRNVGRPLVVQPGHIADRRIIRDLFCVQLTHILLCCNAVDFAQLILYRRCPPAGCRIASQHRHRCRSRAKKQRCPHGDLVFPPSKHSCSLQTARGERMPSPLIHDCIK